MDRATSRATLRAPVQPLYESLLESWSHHRVAWVASTTVTLAAYLAVALAIPIVLARIPADHFTRPPRRHRPFVRFLRTLIGLLVTAGGVAMLFLPGPGILTMILGLSIIGSDLAARGVRKLIFRPRVLEAINEIRRRRGREPLLPPCSAQPGDDRPHDSA